MYTSTVRLVHGRALDSCDGRCMVVQVESPVSSGEACRAARKISQGTRTGPACFFGREHGASVAETVGRRGCMYVHVDCIRRVRSNLTLTTAVRACMNLFKSVDKSSSMLVHHHKSELVSSSFSAAGGEEPKFSGIEFEATIVVNAQPGVRSIHSLDGRSWRVCKRL